MTRTHAARKRAEPSRPATGESEARRQAIINTVVDGIITIDARGRIDSVNPAAERIFGYPARELVGRNVSILMPEPYSRQHDAYIQRYLKTGRARIVGIGREVVGRRRNGTTFPMDLAVSEVKVGKLHLFTGVVRDITERKRAEQAISAVSEEERRRFGRELHDGLGQQLTGVALLSRALQSKLAATGHPASADAADIAELTNRVLNDLKRQAHGLYPVELERHGLAAALEELAVNHRSLFGIACEFRASGTVPYIETGTALHLYRIAQEAAHNAVKHGKAKRVCIRIERLDNVLHMAVEDDGCGLPARKKGRGMGLTIMKHRAASIGAGIEFSRPPRGGTVVRVLWKLPGRAGKRSN
jgi:two-component system sensor kinase FixL